MAVEPKRVVVIQDASKELNLRVFYWVMNSLSLKQADTVTLLAILHKFYTPMGYKSIVDNNAMVGVNQRIIEEQLAWKKQEYLNHGALEMIAELYESNKFKGGKVNKKNEWRLSVQDANLLKATSLGSFHNQAHVRK